MTKALIRSMNRRGSDRTRARPSHGRKSLAIRRFATVAARCIREKPGGVGRRVAPEVMNRARWVECPGCAQPA
jgi:hypothetical protein